MEQAKSAAILAWPTPHNIKEVQSFLGFANLYCHFILNFSEIVTPLTCLTCKDTPFEWKDKQQKVFTELKTAFSSTPILTHLNPNDPIVVETDASNYVTAAILSQISPKDGNIHPITFYPRGMSPAELNYEICWIIDDKLLSAYMRQTDGSS